MAYHLHQPLSTATNDWCHDIDISKIEVATITATTNNRSPFVTIDQDALLQSDNHVL
jgi:hypothetical protein